MPKSSTHLTIARQWKLLRLLPTRRPGKTAAMLREQLDPDGFPVTKRTVERDLCDLSTLFPIRSNEIAKPFGWYWADGGESLLPEMDATAALSLCLAESTLRKLLPTTFLTELDQRFNRARENLKGASKTPQGKWRGKVRVVPTGIELEPPSIPPEVFAAVHAALLTDKALQVSYQGPDAAPKELDLHPLGLVLRGSVAYLVATAFAFDDPRIYALHRIKRAEVSEATRSRKPKRFSLDTYLASGAFGFGEPRPIQLEAEISPDLGKYLAETPLPGTHISGELSNGWLRLAGTVQDTWELRWWILSQGRKIRVKRPRALREAIREELERALEGYDPETEEKGGNARIKARPRRRSAEIPNPKA